MAHDFYKPKAYMALVHHPIVNKKGETGTSSVTNMDLHDIARTCRTFDFKKYFVVTPIEEQHQLVNKIRGFWNSKAGVEYNEDRTDAFSTIQMVYSLQESYDWIEKTEGVRPYIVVTSAKREKSDGEFPHLLDKLQILRRPFLILYGTGWGLAEEVMKSADFRLFPIDGLAEDGYNHLSVRSAVAIYGDRWAQALNRFEQAK